MKRVVLIFGMFTALAAARPAAAGMMTVQVREGQLRQTPSFLGKIVGRVSYGEQVMVEGEKAGWSQVRLLNGKMGWIHDSALTEEKLVVQAGKGNVGTGASSDELALAGKGFNSDIEAEFKKRNQDIDFTWIDRMEKIVVTPEETIVFFREGGVTPTQGGGQ